MRVLVVAAVVVALVGAGGAPARAEETDRMKAFITESRGRLLGRVVDEAGRPLKSVKVSVTPREGKAYVVRTDADGRFQATIPTGGAAVFIRGEGRFSEQTMVVTQQKGRREEEVDIQDTLPAAVPPELVSDPGVPEYSEEALESDVWTRAWLLVEIGTDGRVTRVKLLHRPGHGLDDIAVRAAHELRFKPARNRADRPVTSAILWTFEWPSPSFMVRRRGTITARLPAEVKQVRCKGSGPSNGRWLRDCTPSDVSAALTLPWLTVATRP